MVHACGCSFSIQLWCRRYLVVNELPTPKLIPSFWAPVDNQRADLDSPLSTSAASTRHLLFSKRADGLTFQSGNLWTHHSPYFLSRDYHQHHEYISTIRSGSGGAYSGIVTTKGGREGKDDPIFEVSDHMMCESLILLMCGCVEH